MKYAVVVSSILIFSSPALINSAIAVEPTPKTITSTDDIPEEVMRTEVITGARSPIDNKPMTATEYNQLQTQIETLNQTPPKVSDKVRNTIALLKLRKFIKTVLPFIPIK